MHVFFQIEKLVTIAAAYLGAWDKEDNTKPFVLRQVKQMTIVQWGVSRLEKKTLLQEVGPAVKENTGSEAESSVSKSPANFRHTV